MKRLFITFIGILAMLPTLHAEYFVGKYLDDSAVPIEYQLDFETLEGTTDEVGVYYNFSNTVNRDDITNLRLPETVTFNGKTYTVTTIMGITEGDTGKVNGTLYIPKTIKRILNRIDLSVESIVIEDAPIEDVREEFTFRCPKLKTIDFGNAIKYVGGFETTIYSGLPGCPALESVSIPPSVERIGARAFKGIPSLKSVKLSSSIKSVGVEAFADCETLAIVETDEVSDNVAEFESEVFKNCKSLKSVSLPNVSSISAEMFRYCNSLEYVKVGDKSFGDDKGIESFAFENCVNLTRIDIPTTFSFIRESAFRNCSALSSVPISWNTYIGDGAFSGCSSIVEYKVEGKPDPDNEWREHYYAENGILYKTYDNRITLSAYPSGKRDISFSVPETVKEIGHYAFSGATHLEEVTIPASVEKIGVNLFAGCLELKKVSLPDGIEYIPYGTFSDCNNLKEISLPDNIVYISGSAFADCESLAEIKLPAQLKTFGNASFRGCKSLETLTIPDGVAEIRANTLSNCTSLKSVTLPARLDSIQYGAFQGCSSLQEINLPSTLSGLGERAFKDCSSLRSVNIPTGVRNLGMSAFENCTALKTADTGDGMEKIGEFAFYNCSSLENMTLGVSLTEIGDEAFMGDDAITSIVCKGATPPDYFTGFSDTVMKNAIVTVPEGAEDIYHNNPAWTQMVKGSSIAETIITEDMEYSVYSITGICLRTGCRGKNIDGLPQGTYILRYSNGVTKKLQL